MQFGNTHQTFMICPETYRSKTNEKVTLHWIDRFLSNELQGQVRLDEPGITWSEKFSLDVIKSTGMASCKGPNEKTYMVIKPSAKEKNEPYHWLGLRGYHDQFIWFDENHYIITGDGCGQSNNRRINANFRWQSLSLGRIGNHRNDEESRTRSMVTDRT